MIFFNQFGGKSITQAAVPCCNFWLARIDLEDFRKFMIHYEEFLLHLVENPMVFQHESFTDLILVRLPHLTEESKARGDLSTLPPSDKSHFTTDIQRAYTQLIHDWIKYMEYLKIDYPYLFSLAMRKNPFDESASGHCPEDPMSLPFSPAGESFLSANDFCVSRLTYL